MGRNMLGLLEIRGRIAAVPNILCFPIRGIILGKPKKKQAKILIILAYKICNNW